MTTEMSIQIPITLDFQQDHLFDAQVSDDQTTAALTKMFQRAWQEGTRSAEFIDKPKALSCCIRFVDRAEGQSLNEQFRGRDGPTNVLSFETAFVDEAECQHVGDLVLCVPVLEVEAEQQEKPLKAHYVHLVLHGILHLIGYDHQTADGRRVMEALEIKLLNEVGIANPYEVTGNE